MKKTLGLSITAGAIMFLSGCANANQEHSITAVGSSALQPLVETAAEEFQAKNPGKVINVQGGGSGTGLSQVQTGAVEIGNSDLFAEEKSGIDASKLIDHRVAVVGITPIVNKKVGVTDISMENLRKIFTGEIKNWKQLGGVDQEIVLLNRAKGSGTRSTFEKWVMQDQETKPSQEQDSSGMVRQIVQKTPGAISYVAFSYVTKDVGKLSIDGVNSTDENVQSNDWKIWSYEHMYTQKEQKQLTKDFIDYLMSDETQNTLVKEIGYIPVSKMKVERDVNGEIIK